MDRGPARNVSDAVLLLEVIGRLKQRSINCLSGRAGKDDAGKNELPTPCHWRQILFVGENRAKRVSRSASVETLIEDLALGTASSVALRRPAMMTVLPNL
jgi:hypothetical protein